MPHKKNQSALVRVAQNDRRAALSPLQNSIPAVQSKTAPRLPRQATVAFKTMVRQNWPNLGFKKLKVLGIRINQVHANNATGGKRFGQ